MPARHAALPTERYRPRHRGQSASNRALVVGGAGVGAVAATIIAPTAAHATTIGQWDRVAACESGGNWAADTGNGYYGGLQFAAETWDGFGGGSYASLASEATKREQIVIADRVLAAQGWGAWPVCSQRAGVADTPTTQPAGNSPRLQGSKVAAGRDHHRRIEQEQQARQDRRRRIARRAARTDRTTANTYRVVSGDTLISIAAHEREVGGWHHLYNVNRAVIGSNPSAIRPGELLHVRSASYVGKHRAS